MKFKMAALRHLGFGDTACVFRKKISYCPKDLPCQRAPLHHDLQSETYYVQLPGLLLGSHEKSDAFCIHNSKFALLVYYSIQWENVRGGGGQTFELNHKLGACTV